MKQVPAHSNNFGVGRAGQTIKYVIVHWIVGSLSSADATFQNPNRKASAHYGIEDNEIHQYVQEKDTAWHASNLSINQQSIGIEHSGGELLSDNTRRKPSEETHQTSGKLIGEICRRYNIPIDSEHILPHKNFSSTQCPGTLDINKLISIAKGTPMADVYKGYDLTNRDSMKVAVDHLVAIQNKEYVKVPKDKKFHVVTDGAIKWSQDKDPVQQSIDLEKKAYLREEEHKESWRRITTALKISELSSMDDATMKINLLMQQQNPPPVQTGNELEKLLESSKYQVESYIVKRKP